MSEEQADFRRLSIRGSGANASLLRVYCPRRETDVLLDECSACGSCLGVSLRDAYLVCCWDPSQAGALAAPETQNLRALRAAAGSERLPLLSLPFRVGPLARFERAALGDAIEGNVDGPESR